MSIPHSSLATALIRRDLLGPRALNPQPLPPKATAFKKPDPIGPRALNPQPLPPRERFVARELSSYSLHSASVRENVAAARIESPFARLASMLRAMFGG
jgi:hypothetical protein